MTKKINIRKVDGGAIINIDEELKTFTDVFIFSDYIYGEKRDKFHTPAGNKIFEQLNHFEIVYSCSSRLTCDIQRYSNGYYVTIKKGEKIIYEFVEDFLLIPEKNQTLRGKVNCKLFEVISKIVNEHFATSLTNTYASVLEFEIKN